MSVCEYVYLSTGACRGPKTELGPLELEFEQW